MASSNNTSGSQEPADEFKPMGEFQFRRSASELRRKQSGSGRITDVMFSSSFGDSTAESCMSPLVSFQPSRLEAVCEQTESGDESETEEAFGSVQAFDFRGAASEVKSSGRTTDMMFSTTFGSDTAESCMSPLVSLPASAPASTEFQAGKDFRFTHLAGAGGRVTDVMFKASFEKNEESAMSPLLEVATPASAAVTPAVKEPPTSAHTMNSAVATSTPSTRQTTPIVPSSLVSRAKAVLEQSKVTVKNALSLKDIRARMRRLRPHPLNTVVVQSPTVTRGSPHAITPKVSPPVHRLPLATISNLTPTPGSGKKKLGTPSILRKGVKRKATIPLSKIAKPGPRSKLRMTGLRRPSSRSKASKFV